MMKKSRLQEIRAKYGAGAIKAQALDRADEIIDRAAAKTRADFFPRWQGRMKELGKPCETMADLDLDDPQISVEWRLCDPRELRKYNDPKARDDFLASLTPEQRAYVDGANGSKEQERFYKTDYQHTVAHPSKTIIKKAFKR